MKRFKRIYIEITNVCNMACDFCPVTKRKSDFMTLERFDQVTTQIQPFTDYIYLHIKGEPLLHPKLEAILDIAGKKNLKVQITTNGTLIEERKDLLLRQAAIRQMNLSLHSFDENGGEGDASSYLMPILAFVAQANEETQMIISLRFWNLNEDNAINTSLDKNREMLTQIETYFNVEEPILSRVQPGRGVKIRDRIYVNQDHVFDWPSMSAPEDDAKGYCHGLSDQIGILVDGTVVPCCLDGEGDISLGNILEESFDAIIESPRAKAMLQGFRERKALEELCRKCGYRKKFG